MKLKLKPLTHTISRMLMFVSIFSSMLIITPTTLATTIGDLQKQQLLTIDTWLSTQTSSNQASANTIQDKPVLTAAIGEQIILNIELGTNRWFTAGTQIPDIELPNVMSRQREQFSINSSKRIKGETWYFQRWQISLLPQASGSYEVPALNLSIEVMSPEDGKVAGNIISQAQRFDVILPDASLVDNQWFSASDVNIKQQWQQSNADLYVGDSITRIIIIEASNTLSVLLPKTLKQGSQEKFQAYNTPSRLQDTEQRGDYLATRTEQQTYIVQQGGKLDFPDLVIRWWDTENKQMQEQILKGQSVMVEHTLSSWLHYYRTTLLIISALLIGLVGVTFVLIKHYRQDVKPTWWLFIKAVQAKAWPHVLTILYTKIRHTNQQITLSEGIDKQQHATQIQQGVIATKQANKLQSKLAFQLWFAIRDKNQKMPLSMVKRLINRLLPRALPQLEKRYKKED
ncbi:MAG: hypothetical protein V7782_09220 [Psychromonas sp.]